MTQQQKTGRKKYGWARWVVATAIIGGVYINAKGVPLALREDNAVLTGAATNRAPWITQELRKSMKNTMELYGIPWEPENILEWGIRINDAVSKYPWVKDTEISDCMVVNKHTNPSWTAEYALNACTEAMARR